MGQRGNARISRRGLWVVVFAMLAVACQHDVGPDESTMSAELALGSPTRRHPPSKPHGDPNTPSTSPPTSTPPVTPAPAEAPKTFTVRVGEYVPGETQKTMELPGDTLVYRAQDPKLALVPHESPFFDPSVYGLSPQKTWEVLYVCTNREILEGLRKGQGYFEEGAKMFEAKLEDLVKASGDGTLIFEDVKFNISVVGDAKGRGLILVREAQKK